MAEYDMPIEEQIKVLVKEFRSFKESVETRFDSIDTKLTTVDAKVTTLDTKVTTLDTKVTTLDAKVTTLDAKVTTLDAKVTTLDAKVASLDTSVTTLDTKVTTLDSKIDKVQVLLEDTNAIAKLGLEGLQGLRESTDAKFAAAAKTNGEQTDLLKSVLVHVRKRVERLEGPKRRRRPEFVFPAPSRFVAVFHVLADERREAVAGFGELLHVLDPGRAGLGIAEVIDPAGREFHVDGVFLDVEREDAVLFRVPTVGRHC